MKKYIICLFISFAFVSTTFSAAAYEITGTVKAIKTQSSSSWPCHISFNIPENYYNGKFHAAPSERYCSSALVGYISGERVTVSATVDDSSNVNNINSITLPEQ